MAAMTLCGCMRVVMVVLVVGTQGANAQDWLEKWLKNRANGNIKLTDDLGFIGRTRRSVPSRPRMATRDDLLTSSEPEEPPMTSEKGRLLSTLTSRTIHRPTTLGITESSMPQTDSGPMTSEGGNGASVTSESDGDASMTSKKDEGLARWRLMCDVIAAYSGRGDQREEEGLQLQTFQDVFQVADKNKDGTIAANELDLYEKLIEAHELCRMLQQSSRT